MFSPVGETDQAFSRASSPLLGAQESARCITDDDGSATQRDNFQVIECGWVGEGGAVLHFFFPPPPPVYSGARCRYQGANDWKLITSHRLGGTHRSLIKKQKLTGAPPPFHLSLCYISGSQFARPQLARQKPVSVSGFSEFSDAGKN